MPGKTIAELHVGDTACRVRTVTQEDILSFARVTGDLNPIHLDEQAAAESVFGRRVAHGMLVGSLFSPIFGMDLPGEGCIYMGQELKFLKPVYPGDEITATVTVTALIPEKNRALFDTLAVNQRGEKVVCGTATLYPPKG